MTSHYPASFDKRLLAQTIDITLLLPLIFLLDLIWEVRPHGYWLFYFAFYYTYVIPFELSPLRGTPGKKLLGLVVLTSSDGPLYFRACLLRNLGKWLSLLPVSLGFFMVYFHPLRKSLHDILSSTKVVDTSPVK